MRERRFRVWTDRFQTNLFFRIILYWFLFLFSVWNFLFLWQLLKEGAGEPWEQYVRFCQDFYPMLLCFLIVVPYLAWDAVRLAHRVVGPIHRFRKTIQAVTADQPIPPIKLREGDYLVEMEEDLNAMLQALQRRGAVTLSAAPRTAPESPAAVTPSQEPA
jgi:hypothetical protein